jgi:two-component system, LytTR family, response regulator
MMFAQTLSTEQRLTIAVMAAEDVFAALEQLGELHNYRALRFDRMDANAQIEHACAAVLVDADAFTLESEFAVPLIVLSQFADQAVRAFDVNALDFLTKPIKSERLAIALQKLRGCLARKNDFSRPGRHTIPLEVGRSTELVDQLDIDYLSVHSNYVSVFVNRREFVTRNTLESMQAALDPQRFLRVHRSYVVQLNAVHKVQKLSSDRFALHLRSGEKICTARSAKESVRKHLGLVA